MPNYVVDPLNGADPNSGLTESTAWKTVKKASDTIMPGDDVRLRGGNYLANDGNAGLRTKRSGQQGAYITFRAYENELPVFKHQYLGIAVEHSYIRFLGLGVINDVNGLMESGICHWQEHGAISHVVVDGCTVQNVMPSDPRHGIRLENLTYGIIRKNKVDHIGTAPQPGPEGGNGLWITGHYNLIEENETDYCGHAGIFAMGDKIVVRRNNCNGTWGVPAEYLCYGTTAYRSLVEDNILRNASGLQDGLWRDPAWEQMGSGTIFRRNVMFNSIGAGMQFYSRSDYQTKFIRAYFNVIYNCGGIPPPSYITCPYELNEEIAGTMGDIVIKNNINFANKNNGQMTLAGFASAADITFLSCLWNGTNPLFRDAPGGDFRLLQGSPAIDTGEFLTTTRSSGSGQSIPVVDSRYFCDGWGIVEGDWIQLEGTDVCTKILNIDYVNHVLNVADSLAWTAGQGISLPFVGPRPDKGAFEYIGGYMPTASINLLLHVLEAQGFTVGLNPAEVSINRGKMVTTQVAIAAVGGYAKPVTLSVPNLPANITAAFSANPINPGATSVLTLTAAAGAEIRDHTLEIKGVGPE